MPEVTAKQEGMIRLLNMENTPFKEIREILAQQGRSLEAVQDVKINVETQEVPSKDGEWESHMPTGKWTITVVFDKMTFERDENGVRLLE